MPIILHGKNLFSSTLACKIFFPHFGLQIFFPTPYHFANGPSLNSDFCSMGSLGVWLLPLNGLPDCKNGVLPNNATRTWTARYGVKRNKSLGKVHESEAGEDRLRTKTNSFRIHDSNFKADITGRNSVRLAVYIFKVC